MHIAQTPFDMLLPFGPFADALLGSCLEHIVSPGASEGTVLRMGQYMVVGCWSAHMSLCASCPPEHTGPRHCLSAGC